MSKRRFFRITEEDVNALRARTLGLESFDIHSQWVKRVPELDPLIHEITEAFDGITLGDGIGLLEANGIDDYASPGELAELRSRDEKTDWRRIESTLLNYCNASPTYFDDRGYWFHLPAFLINDLNDEFHTSFIERMIVDLKIHRGWIELLTLPQRVAIIRTLELLRSHPEFTHMTNEFDTAIHQINYPNHKTQDR